MRWLPVDVGVLFLVEVSFCNNSWQNYTKYLNWQIFLSLFYAKKLLFVEKYHKCVTVCWCIGNVIIVFATDSLCSKL